MPTESRCRLCALPGPNEICARCWELESRIQRDPVLAQKILNARSNPDFVAERCQRLACRCGHPAAHHRPNAPFFCTVCHCSCFQLTGPVHNHGTEDGPGMSCPEIRVRGQKVGRCVVLAPADSPADTGHCVRCGANAAAPRVLAEDHPDSFAGEAKAAAQRAAERAAAAAVAASAAAAAPSPKEISKEHAAAEQAAATPRDPVDNRPTIRFTSPPPTAHFVALAATKTEGAVRLFALDEAGNVWDCYPDGDRKWGKAVER